MASRLPIDKIVRYMSVDIYNVLKNFTPEQWADSNTVWRQFPSNQPADLVEFIVNLTSYIPDQTVELHDFPTWCTRVGLGESYARHSVETSTYNYVPRSRPALRDYIFFDPNGGEIYHTILNVMRNLPDQDLMFLMLYRGDVVPDQRMTNRHYSHSFSINDDIKTHLYDKESVFVQAFGHIALELNSSTLMWLMFQSQYKQQFKQVMTPDQLKYVR